MRCVDVDPERVRILLHHRLRPVTELVGVLIDVLRGDGELRFLILEWIAAAATGLVTCNRRRVAAIPRRDRAFLVTGLLAAKRRELGLQLCRFVASDGAKGRQRGGQCDRTRD